MNNLQRAKQCISDLQNDGVSASSAQCILLETIAYALLDIAETLRMQDGNRANEVESMMTRHASTEECTDER